MDKSLNRYIPLLQMAGAANALAFCVSTPKSEGAAGLVLFFFAIFVIYGLGFAGGVLLWKNLRLGAALSIGHWLLVMPTFTIPLIMAYDLNNIVYANLLFSLGGDITSTFVDGGMRFAQLTIWMSPESTQTVVGVDLVAITMTIYVASRWRKLDRLVSATSAAPEEALSGEGEVNSKS